jgi:hypothetical protein
MRRFIKWYSVLALAVVGSLMTVSYSFAAASTVTGIDYSTMFDAASDELLVLLPPIVTVGVGVTVALWAIRIARRVFKSFAR